MTERIPKRKQTPPNFHSNGSGEDIHSDSDSIATDSTVMSEYDAEKVYTVEQILAEKGRGNSKFYLIKWLNYPDERASWEPEHCIIDKSTIVSWKSNLAQVKAGKVKAFDVAAWELKTQKLAKERKERKARRQEKRRRRTQKASSGAPKVASKVLVGDQDSDDEPILRRRLPKAIEAASDEDDEPLSFVKRASTDRQPEKKKRIMTQQRDDSESESDARGGQARKTSKNSPTFQENQKRPEAQRTVHSSTNSPDAGSPPLSAQELPRALVNQAAPSRTASHSTQGTVQPLSASAGEQVVKRPRGRPPGSGRGGGATRGATRGRGRSGALPATANVFSRSEIPKVTKRSLSNALSPVVAEAEEINQSELSKNLSHRRKLENASRAMADRPPDLAVLGGLVNPSKIGSRAYPILKPQDYRQPEAQPRQSSGNDAIPSTSTPPPPSRRASTNRVRFMDDSDDGSGVIFEEPASIVENQGDKVPNRGDSPPKRQMVAHGIDQPDAPGQSQFGNVITKPKPILRTPTPNWSAPNQSTPQPPLQPRPESIPNARNSTQVVSNEWASRQALLPRPETIPNTTSIHVAPTQAVLPLNASNQSEPTRLALDRKTSTGERKKVSLSDYSAKQRIERGGNLVQQASFGEFDTNQILIAFMGVPRSSQDPWVTEISSLTAINFIHVCLATDFQAQPSLAGAKVLGHGSIATNSETAISVDRLSEHLRLRLGGIVFNHNSIAILLFPTRLEEWKFLEKSDVPNTVSLRYHIFELPEFCPTIFGNPMGDASSVATLEPPYWTSAVQFLCALNYDSLLPSLGVPPPPGQKRKEQDRDNFFLLVPESATPSPRFLITWLRSCKPSCTVLTNQKPGSWAKFIEHARRSGSAGSLLIHESLISHIPKLPHLHRLFSSRCNFVVFSLNICPAPDPELSLRNPVPSAIVTTRLFPLGGAFFFAPTLIIADPTNVAKFIRWFRKKQEENSTPGTYKLLGCHRLREFLLNIADEKAVERRELIAQANGRDVELEAENRGISLRHNALRYQIFKMIDEMMEKADANLTPHYNLDELEEDESPIICAPAHIARDDESRLLSWFAGWSLLNVDKYKKFWFVGTDTTNIHKAVRIFPTDITTVTSVPVVADLASVATPSSPLENGVRWKKTGFTAVTEVAPAPLFSTVAALSQSHVPEDAFSPLTRSPTFQQEAISEKTRPYPAADVGMSSKLQETTETGKPVYSEADRRQLESFEEKIEDFIRITRSSDQIAIDYLGEFRLNVEAAIEAYHKFGDDLVSAIEAYRKPKTDDFIRTTGSTEEQAKTYLAGAEYNLEAAVEAYRNASGAAPQSVPTQPPLFQPLPSHPPQTDGSTDAPDHNSINNTSGSRPSSSSGVVVEEDGRRVVPASIRGDGSMRKEIGIRPGYVAQEDQEVWRSPTVLSMVPRNVRQNASAHLTNSKQKNGKLGTAPKKDENGDVIMSEANEDDISLPPLTSSEAQISRPATSPSGGAGMKKRTESSSTGILLTEDERSRSPSRGSSPSKQESRRASSSLPMATTELYKSMELNGAGENHIKVLGIKEVFHQLGIP